ncbi:MAG: Holliday junction branch migration protein RuvA [Bacteroidetes bacterium]|nr:MAG: Holliday junction branch migration protein RuvA [Bacteroidota bacterium]
MIAYLNGALAELEPTHAIVECGGIGYHVRISLQTYSRLQGQKTAKVFTYFQVREDAQILYGFAERQEQQLFEQLISITGVGGNTALMILSGLSPEELFQAIQQEDTAALKRVKGIGAKTAGRIVLELRDRIQIEGAVSPSLPSGGMSRDQRREEALAALTQLGLGRQDMVRRVDRILKEQGGDLSVEQIIKHALRN